MTCLEGAYAWGVDCLTDESYGPMRPDGASEHMVLWPVVALIGFLVLVAVVVALGTMSTNRYEREQRTRASFPRRPRQPVRRRERDVARDDAWPTDGA